MKTWTEVSAGSINAANQRLWVAFGESAEQVAGRINSDPDFVERVARFVVNGSYQMPESHQIAREVMGKNFFGVEDAIKHFGLNPTRRQLASLACIPFDKEMLRSCSDTHVLVAVFPLSILDMRNQCREVEPCIFSQPDENSGYDNQDFAKTKGEVGWHLVCKVPFVSTMKSATEEQEKSLPRDERECSARVRIYAIIGHFRVTGERLFKNIVVRCSDTDSIGRNVYVGCFDRQGVYIKRVWDPGV